MSLMRVVITIDGAVYETTDEQEAIGPWIARIFSATRPTPHSLIRIEVF
jgi:hypothetical protein